MRLERRLVSASSREQILKKRYQNVLAMAHAPRGRFSFACFTFGEWQSLDVRPASGAKIRMFLVRSRRVRSEERKQDSEIDSVGHAVMVQVGLGIVRSPEGQEDSEIASADDAIMVEIALGIAAG